MKDLYAEGDFTEYGCEVANEIDRFLRDFFNKHGSQTDLRYLYELLMTRMHRDYNVKVFEQTVMPSMAELKENADAFLVSRQDALDLAASTLTWEKP